MQIPAGVFSLCKTVRVSEKLFQRLVYSRKTERYRQTIELVRIILLKKEKPEYLEHDILLAPEWIRKIMRKAQKIG